MLEHKKKPCIGEDCPGCSMCKGGSYAEGGRVGDYTKNEHGEISKIREKGVSSQGEAVRNGDSLSATKIAYDRRKKERNINGGNRRPLEGLAHGGEVGDEHEDADQDESMMDDEMHDMMGEELMSAIDAKDKKRIMESIETMVMSCMNKRMS
jgi:hypothetical protein